MAARNVMSSYFVALRNGPSSTCRLNTSVAAMAVDNNNNWLLYCPEGSFVLVDEQQNELMNIERNFKVSDICFSSFLSQFLILSYKPENALFLLNPSTHNLQQIKKYSQTMWSCTCYDRRFIVSKADNGSAIEVYDLNDVHQKPIQTFIAPQSCEANHQIEKIRLNSDGNRLGMILRQEVKPNYYYWFELRDTTNMSVILKTNIHPNNDEWCWLLPLPNQQFLATLWKQKRLFLFDSDGRLEDTARYDQNVKYLNSIELINRKWLIVQTWQPDQLHFHNLKT